MFGLNVRTYILILLFLFCSTAQAKKSTLAGNNPFGLGFVAGIEKAPSNEFIKNSQRNKGSFSKYFSFEPFFDFSNFVIKLVAGLHDHPPVSGQGSDSNGTFTENSNAKTYAYGAKIMLVPLISQDETVRLYFALEFAYAQASLKNTRKYSSQTYSEKIKGTSQDFAASLGGEIILIQNYSLQLEGGFREMKFKNLRYAGSNDLTGAAKTTGDPALDANGIAKKFRQAGYFTSLSLNINF